MHAIIHVLLLFFLFPHGVNKQNASNSCDDALIFQNCKIYGPL